MQIHESIKYQNDEKVEFRDEFEHGVVAITTSGLVWVFLKLLIWYSYTYQSLNLRNENREMIMGTDSLRLNIRLKIRVKNNHLSSSTVQFESMIDLV